MKFSAIAVVALFLQAVNVAVVSAATTTAEEMTDQQCLDLCAAQRQTSLKIPAGTSMINAVSDYLRVRTSKRSKRLSAYHCDVGTK